MVGDAKDDVGETVTPTDTEIKKKKKKRGFLSRLWGALFRVRGDDFEKRLEHISKEEAAVLTRIAKRSHSGRRVARNIVIFFILSEVIAIGYAYMSTRTSDLYWKIRALRVLPMFLLPMLGVITYTALKSYTRMRDQKDRNTLEELRAERQAKIDELKERTNYYTTQQLIQRYDPDPAAKAAAATVLASKLGADSGLKVYVGDDSNVNAPTGRSNDIQVARSGGLRNRKQSLAKTSSAESGLTHKTEEGMLSEFEGAAADDVAYQQQQLVVEHYPQSGVSSNDGGWIARFAALLVGEDPTQSYALICGNCHMHNGLVRKEDFPYITYYCPHCKALNRPKQSGDLVSSSSSPTVASVAANAEDTQMVPPSSSLAGPGSIRVGDNVPPVSAGLTTSDISPLGAAASGIPES